MDDLIDDDGPLGGNTPAQNAPEFSVSDLTGAVKRTLEGAFGRVRVRGELGRVMRAGSGHYYYDLKDDRNVISCNTWKGQVAGLGMVPEEGLEVIVTGRLSTYGPQSRYNLNVDRMEVAGEGALMVMLEKRRQKLMKEGLFEEARKRPLPYLPEVIGVVTSPQGAVIRDILHRLRDRFPRQVLIWPVPVQGERCAPEVTRAIKGFNELGPGDPVPLPDLIIVARGGGSLEDLWGFNEESVVRAAAESEIPLISAVGHETDTTLIDFASDRRAPTPTAAAEMAVPVRLDLLAWVEAQSGHLTRALGGGITQRRQRLGDLSRALPRVESLLDTPRQRLDRWSDRLEPGLRAVLERQGTRLERVASGLGPALSSGVQRRRVRLGQASGRLSLGAVRRGLDEQGRMLARIGRDLDRAFATRQERAGQRLANTWRLFETLGYKATLRRGYAVLREGDTVISDAAAASAAATLEVEFADGRVQIGAASGGSVQQPKADPLKGTAAGSNKTRPQSSGGAQKDLFGE
ncbi:MAG: exodeoxyribonuclease VII large subunit [Pseudomonadota bacterium]